MKATKSEEKYPINKQGIQIKAGSTSAEIKRKCVIGSNTAGT